MAGLTGIASGADTDALVAKLVDAESGRRQRMDWTQAQINARSTGLSSVQTKLIALRTATQGLRDLATWNETQTVESSDPKVGVRRTGAAAAGGASVDVLGLARAEQRTYGYVPPAADDTLQVGSTSFAVKAGSTLSSLVSTINATSGSPVFASEVGGQLVLTARATGTVNGFTTTGGAVTEDTTKARVAQDASYRIDGGPLQTSSSNVVANALPGLELTLKGVTSTSAGLSVGVSGADQDLVKSKVQAFITAYNDVVTTTQGLTNEEKVVGAANATDYAKGALRGDTGLTGMLAQLRQAISDPVSGMTGLTSFADIGVSTGKAGTVASADARAGLLTLDATKLTSALGDPQAVRKLLGGITGTDGMAQRLETAVKGQIGGSGALGRRLVQATADQTDLQKAMTREDTRLAAVEARYKKQFAAMESALQNAQSQQAWLTGQIASLG